MNILYCFERDACQPATQSGRPYSILGRLRSRASVSLLSPIKVPSRIQVGRYLKSPSLIPAKVRGHSLGGYAYSGRLRYIARVVEERARFVNPDVIFAPGFTTTAFVGSDVPIAFCNDATFGGLVDYYPCHSGMAEEAVRDGMQSNTEALRRAAAAIYPSEWAAETAVRLHGADPAKLVVIPWGANLAPADRDAALAAVAERDLAHPRLLFVGKEWRRKGGPLALATCELLRRGGIQCTLDIVGPTSGLPQLPAYCTLHGSIDPGSAEGSSRLRALFRSAALVFVPSRAEAFGMTFCEAAAFAVPVVSTNTGGIPSIVKDGVTGRLLACSAGPAQYAAAISALLESPSGYRNHATAARDDFEERLNWDHFAGELMKVLERVVGGDCKPPAAAALPTA